MDISAHRVVFCAKMVTYLNYPGNSLPNYFRVSTNWGRSCERTARLLKTGHLGSDFREGVPRMYKHQEILMVGELCNL